MSTRKTRPSARRVAALVAAVAALVMSSGIVLLATAPGANAAPGDKWFVCKFKHTPGNAEELQSGQNPISVSENAILASLPKDDRDTAVIAPGFSFADNQGRSEVLVQDTGQDEPSADECLPRPDVVIAVDVSFVDPTCDNDNTPSYSVTGDTDNATVEQSADPAAGEEITVTATANDGFMFAGGSDTYSETHTFADAEDCTVVTPPVVTPPVVEPPVTTPTIVHAGLVSTPVDSNRNEQGLALLASGLVLMAAAGGLARRGARR